MGQTAPGTLTTLFNFPLNAGQPQAGVLIGPGGVLYGSDWQGGSIYLLTPPATGADGRQRCSTPFRRSRRAKPVIRPAQ